MNLKVIITTLIIQLFLISCIDGLFGNKYTNEISKAKSGIEQFYTVTDLFEHFPKSISSDSYRYSESQIPQNFTNIDNAISGYSYLFIDMEKETHSFYPTIYLYKTQYSAKNFIVDHSFNSYKYIDTLKIRNVALPGSYPIPYFEDFDFGLGSEKLDLRSTGLPVIVDKFIVPDDLEVFVLKASPGFFWKIKFERERPETLGKWKHGYSSGIAISRKLNTVVYWMKAW